MPSRPQPLIETVPPLPRDPATDRANLVDLQTIGLAVRDPQTDDLVPVLPHPVLGRATTTRAAVNAEQRPDFYRDEPVLVQARNLSAAAPVAVGAGTIRRNVTWPINGNGVRSLFSWAGDASADAPKGFQLTGVAEYLISSLHLMLARPLSWVVAGPKPLIPEGPNGQHAHIMGAPASGWPVIAPQIPSFGASVPLLRPRGLASNQ